MAGDTYTAIVPVKHLALAKRRLHTDETVRRAFAMAFLRDVQDALAVCDRVRHGGGVTSDEAGTAMKSEPVDVGGVKMHRPGTIIGKALDPLPSGRGEILVLLSLQ